MYSPDTRFATSRPCVRLAAERSRRVACPTYAVDAKVASTCAFSSGSLFILAAPGIKSDCDNMARARTRGEIGELSRDLRRVQRCWRGTGVPDAVPLSIIGIGRFVTSVERIASTGRAFERQLEAARERGRGRDEMSGDKA